MMLRGRELAVLRMKLLSWFRQYRRDLPWRRSKDPYRIWLSEIMLQQTRVAAVIPYYDRFLACFPNIETLAAAPEEEVLRFWSGLGYYSRARNLQSAARQIVGKHSGKFPRMHKDALGLAGIGDYTAAAILSMAFGAKHAVLDGNVARVLARLFAIKGDLREGGRWKALQRYADEMLDRKAPGDWNQAMMELGAVLCTPRSPQCLLCPVARFCRARKLGIAESLPARRKKPATVEVQLAAVVLLDSQGKCLLLAPSPRAAKGRADDDVATLVSGLWHFPTAAVQGTAEAEARKLAERLVAKGPKGHSFTMEALRTVRHTVTYRRITMLPFRVRVARLPNTVGTKIVSLAELMSTSSLAISNLTRKIAAAALADSDTVPAESNVLPTKALFASTGLATPQS